MLASRMLRAGAVGVVVLTVATTAGAATRGSITSAELALIPLPKAELGAAAAGLPLAPSSGVQTNKDAAENAFKLTAAQFSRLGRITGYELDYSDKSEKALTAGHGLTEVDTSVELFRNAAAAQAGFAAEFKDTQAFLNTPLKGFKVSLKPFSVSGYGSDAHAFTGTVGVSGKPTTYGTEIDFRVDNALADISVSAADPTEGKPLTLLLGPKLRRRVLLAEAGKLSGRPVPLPGKVKPGPPPNGPDLSKLALTPADLGKGTVAHQGYKVDQDFTPISDYDRDLSPGGVFSDLDEEVELFGSTTEAGYTATLVASGFSSKKLFEEQLGSAFEAKLASFTLTPLRSLPAGDEARGALAMFKLKTGVTVYQAYVVVRTGAAVETVVGTAPANVKLLPSVLTDLAKRTAQRATTGMGAA